MSVPVSSEVVIRFDTDRDGSSLEARRYAFALGFSRREAGMIAIATSELVGNALKFGGHAILRMKALTDPAGMELEVRDMGPGMTDSTAALQDGYSEGVLVDPRALAPGFVRRGLGCGLGAVERLMDELEIDSSPGRGTRVVARKWIPPSG